LRYPNLAAYAHDTIPELGFGPATAADPLAKLGTLFAFHHDSQSRLCAGHVSSVGHEHPLIRLAVIRGLIDPAALQPGDDWPSLYAYQEMVETVGHAQDTTAEQSPSPPPDLLVRAADDTRTNTRRSGVAALNSCGPHTRYGTLAIE